MITAIFAIGVGVIIIFLALNSGCAHKHTSFPIKTYAHGKRNYVVCLDCGKEFLYDEVTL